MKGGGGGGGRGEGRTAAGGKRWEGGTVPWEMGGGGRRGWATEVGIGERREGVRTEQEERAWKRRGRGEKPRVEMNRSLLHEFLQRRERRK